jgi:hypothetical protein
MFNFNFLLAQMHNNVFFLSFSRRLTALVNVQKGFCVSHLSMPHFQSKMEVASPSNASFSYKELYLNL